MKSEGHCYDCVPHQDTWYFNHGEAGALYVEDEADAGMEFDGRIRAVKEKEDEISGEKL